MIRGERLKELRKKHNLTQEELGEILGVTKASVCCYEKETRTPTIENIITLIEQFGVSSDYIIGCDNIVTIEDTEHKNIIMSEEEVEFILELRKDKYVSSVLLEEPIRGMELLKKKIG